MPVIDGRSPCLRPISIDTAGIHVRQVWPCRGIPGTGEQERADNAVRREIYKLLCEETFYPIISQICNHLLRSNAELNVVAAADELTDGEDWNSWRGRKKATGQQLEKKVS